MPQIVKQSIVLPAPAKDLYAMYLNPRTHAAITGNKVLINRGRFRAFGGALTGRVLKTIPGRLIVQAWRSKAFRKDDVDSTLVLRFTPNGRQGRIDLVHVNVPDHDYKGVSKGWKEHYWRPWRRFLARRKGNRALTPISAEV